MDWLNWGDGVLLAMDEQGSLSEVDDVEVDILNGAGKFKAGRWEGGRKLIFVALPQIGHPQYSDFNGWPDEHDNVLSEEILTSAYSWDKIQIIYCFSGICDDYKNVW